MHEFTDDDMLAWLDDSHIKQADRNAAAFALQVSTEDMQRSG